MTDPAAPDAAEKLEATRSRLKAAAKPDRSPALRPAGAPRAPGVLDVSWTLSITEGVEQWWRKSSTGRAIAVLAPLAEPHLRPLARRHYPGLLLASAAVGALVSHYPVRSARTVLRVAGPVLLSGVIFEIAKAGVRQLRDKAPQGASIV